MENPLVPTDRMEEVRGSTIIDRTNRPITIPQRTVAEKPKVFIQFLREKYRAIGRVFLLSIVLPEKVFAFSILSSKSAGKTNDER